MADAYFEIPDPVNEPVLAYAPGSPEKKALKEELQKQASQEIEIPLIIGGKEVRTGNMLNVVMPHNHSHVLAKVHMAGEEEARQAVQAAMEAKKQWQDTPAEARAAIFLRAADLLAGPFRQIANAATMLGQSKTCFQAEIDSACELIDFFRFNCKYMQGIYQQQPMSVPGVWNQVEYRPLDGFVYAITPFNFTSIAGNLPHSPALMGNTVIWKPSRTTILSNYYIMRLFEKAGVPAGVINFLPGNSGIIVPIPASSVKPEARTLSSLMFPLNQMLSLPPLYVVHLNIRDRNVPLLPGRTFPAPSGMRSKINWSLKLRVSAWGIRQISATSWLLLSIKHLSITAGITSIMPVTAVRRKYWWAGA